MLTKSRLFSFMVLLCLAFLVRPAWGQIELLGNHTSDKVLPLFWSSGTNAATTIQGLNANRGTNTFSDAILPAVMSGKTWSGVIVGTNLFVLKTWDTNNGAFQEFHFTLNGSGALSSNTVSRVGILETNSHKHLNLPRFQTNGAPMIGVIVGMGTSPAKAVAGVAGETKVLIAHEYAWSSVTTNSAHYLTVTDGVVTAAQ